MEEEPGDLFKKPERLAPSGGERGPRKPGEFTIGKDAQSEKKDLRKKAEEWIKANPLAMDLFYRFAKEAAATGRKFGVGLLTERVRWECLIYTNGKRNYKISNSHRAYIARHLIKVDPYLEHYMTFRNVAY